MLRTMPLPNTELQISEMALGAMACGTSVSLDDSLKLYDIFRAAGGNIFDTAHIYAVWQKNGLGASERTLGKVLKIRGEQDRMIIMTKGGHPAFMPHYPRPDRYLAPEVVRRDIAESLDRLGVGHVQLFMLHRDDRRVPVGEIIALLNEESAAGRIGHFGVSNWRPARTQEANDFAHARGLHGFVASQPQFSLAEPNTPESNNDVDCRFLTAEDVAWHERTRFPAFCYSPTANGYFASNGKRAAAGYENQISRARLLRAAELAAKRGATPNQIALAWMRGQKFPAIPLLGTGNPEHLSDALAAANVQLTDHEIAWLADG